MIWTEKLVIEALAQSDLGIRVRRSVDDDSDE